MIVGGVFVGAEFHAAACPVGAETTGFDAGQRDVPFGFQLFGEGLVKGMISMTERSICAFDLTNLRSSFNCPLAGTVDGKEGNTALTTNGSYLLDYTTDGGLSAHGFEGFAGHVQKTEEVYFHLFADLLFTQAFEFAGETVSSAVEVLS